MDQDCYKGRQPVHEFFQAARTGAIDKLCKFIDSGEYDVNVDTFQQVTALDQAVTYGQLESVKELVKRGANINVQNFEGWTPLHKACYLLSKDYDKYYEIYEFLIESGADKTIESNSGKTCVDVIFHKKTQNKFLGKPEEEEETKPKQEENPAN